MHKKPKTSIVLCAGTFDILHPGHHDYFRQARKYGDNLIVIVARDETVKQEGKELFYNQEKRLAEVQKCHLVDKAILGGKDKIKTVVEIKPDVICLGYDQEMDEERLREKLAEYGMKPRIYRMKAHEPEKYKSSILRLNLGKV